MELISPQAVAQLRPARRRRRARGRPRRPTGIFLL